MQTLQTFLKIFNLHLVSVLDSRIRASYKLSSDRDVNGIVEYVNNLALSGGKRLRPYLAWTMHRAFGGKKSHAAMDVFAAIELFHIFGLIHDDIIDHGMSRHGIPTVHRAVATRLAKQKRRGDLEHIAEGQAILLGDLIFAWVTQILQTSLSEVTMAHRVSSLFYRMVDEVVIGQMLDVDLMTRITATSQLVDEKMRLKTASYTFVRPMQIGAALAGASVANDRFCEAFGTALGIAFQIQDDMFDLTLSAEQLGKTIFSDLADRQHTVFTQYIFDHGTRAQKKQLTGLLGETLTEKDRARITRLLTDSGALAHGQRLMNVQFDAAAQCVQKARLVKNTKQELLELVVHIRNRVS